MTSQAPPTALRPIAFAAPCRRLHRKSPDVSHGIGGLPEFHALRTRTNLNLAARTTPVRSPPTTGSATARGGGRRPLGAFRGLGGTLGDTTGETAAMATNITEEHRRAFEALTAGKVGTSACSRVSSQASPQPPSPPSPGVRHRRKAASRLPHHPAVRFRYAGHDPGRSRRTGGMSPASPGRRNPYRVPRPAVVSFSAAAPAPTC